MNPDFPFNVGDRVTHPLLTSGDGHIVITAIGNDTFLGVASWADKPIEQPYPIMGEWQLAPPAIQRYTVEIRPAQPGERYLLNESFFSSISFHVWDHPAPSTHSKIVIVHETVSTDADQPETERSAEKGS